MPQPLINNTAKTVGFTAPTTSTANRARLPIRVEQRSNRYLRALKELDAGGRLGATEMRGIVDDIRREFDEKYCSTPIGIVGKCYLGEPFEVHTLALDGEIIEHYRVGETVPGGLERARPLAVSPVYLAVEVYSDRVVCIRADGSTAVLEGGS